MIEQLYSCHCWQSTFHIKYIKTHKHIKSYTIQKRIARLILGKQKYYPSHGLFKELNMLSIYDINKCSLGTFCYKFNFGLLSDVFDNFFTEVSNVHRHNTRFQCNFHVRASRTIYIDKSVKYRGTLLWNQLRDKVKNSPNFNISKKQLVSFLRGSRMSVVPFHKDFSPSDEQLEHRKLAHEL